MAVVFLDGEFVGADAARVSAFDAGLQHGVGLFETMLARVEASGRARVVQVREHVARLAESCRSLGLIESIQARALEDACVHTARRASEGREAGARLRLRLTITGGDLNLLSRARGGSTGEATRPTVMVHATDATPYPRELFERGTSVVVGDLRVNPLDPLQGHKTLAYWGRLRELQAAAGKRAGEALIFQVTNYLAGGCVSNALLLKGGEIVTPIARGEEGGAAWERADGGASAGGAGAVLASPVLPGITRAWALGHAGAMGLEVRTRMVSIGDVLGADEVLLTNSSWGVMPVVKVEGEAIGDGVVGRVGRALGEAWEAMVESPGEA